MTIPSKAEVFRRIRDQLAEQIAAATKAAERAKESFQVGDDRAENRGERGAIQERSWLLSAQAGRLEELQRQLLAVEGIETEARDSVATGALVLLEDTRTGDHEIYLLHPHLGGIEVEVGGTMIFAVSPAAPLGSALLDKKRGDVVDLDLPGGTRSLRIVTVT